jgi:hypothetical protein
MDSRVVMPPVCSDQGTARVIKGPTSVPPLWLQPRAVANPLHGGQRSRRRGDTASICKELDISHMASLDPAPAGESSPCIRLRGHDALVRAGRRDSALSAWPHRLELSSHCGSARGLPALSPLLTPMGDACSPWSASGLNSRGRRLRPGGLTLPLREGPAWLGSQPTAGRAQRRLAGHGPLQIGEGI